MRSQILITALALLLTAAPAAFANPGQGKDRSCEDGEGNWHYCFVPTTDPGVDLIPIYEIVSNAGTVEHGKTISVEADCPTNFYATGGSFKTDTPINGVIVPQRVYISSLVPAFPAGKDQTNSAPIGEIVTVINSSFHTVDVTAFATCTSMTTP
jgi:hypothetical protein